MLDAFFALSPGAVAPIRKHVIRSAEGMASIVARTREGSLTLHSIPELQDYCYIVAGIVGEMLTELFLLDRPALAGVAATMRERAATFGEALQLVNILKDSEGDAREGRRYLPEEVPDLRSLRPRPPGPRRRGRIHPGAAEGGRAARPRRVHGASRCAWRGRPSSASRRAARGPRSAGRRSS